MSVDACLGRVSSPVTVLMYIRIYRHLCRSDSGGEYRSLWARLEPAVIR